MARFDPHRSSDPPPLPAAELREVDRRAEEEFGIPGSCLMENAGAGAARVAQEMIADSGAPSGATVLVLCGGGGNGGDGYVLARHLALRGHRPLLVHGAERSRGDAILMREVCLRLGLEAVDAPDEARARAFLRQGRGAALRAGSEPCSLVVDGLLGTGLGGPPRGAALAWIEEWEMWRSEREMSRSRWPLGLALDLPSGLDADRGLPLGPVAFRADRTATFAAPKQGFSRPESGSWTGRVTLCPIGAPI